MVAFLLAFWTFVTTCWVRFSIWLLAMVAAVFPAARVANVRPTVDLHSIADGVNRAGHFHDLLFVIIIAAIFGISNILYSFLIIDRRVSLWVAPVFATSILFFLYAIIFGIFEFVAVAAAKGAVAPQDFEYDVGFIEFTLLVGVLTEITVAFRERFS